MTDMRGQEIRKSFHTNLAEIREDTIRLAASVVDVIPRGTAILLDDDLEGANLLIQADDEIDARAIDLEERCYELLALQQPMAGDLRRIVAAVRMIGEIERSADLVVNICKGARRLHGHELDPKLRGTITRMGEQAQFLFSRAIDAYADADDALAAAIDDMDNLLDDLQRELIQTIFESHSAGRIDLQVAVQLAVIARFYERIGDHAVNIGQRVQYMVTGWMPEHTGAARYRARRAMPPASVEESAGTP
jgi:phosphate transport system protein